MENINKHIVKAGKLMFGALWQKPFAAWIGALHPKGPRAVGKAAVSRWNAGETVPKWVHTVLAPGFYEFAEAIEVRADQLILELNARRPDLIKIGLIAYGDLWPERWAAQINSDKDRAWLRITADSLELCALGARKFSDETMGIIHYMPYVQLQILEDAARELRWTAEAHCHQRGSQADLLMGKTKDFEHRSRAGRNVRLHQAGYPDASL